MLGSASGSPANYPGHPPAAPGGLGSLVPDLVLGPRKALDFGEVQQPGRRGTTRFFGTGSRDPDRLGSLGQENGTSEPLTGRASGRKPRRPKPLLTRRATLHRASTFWEHDDCTRKPKCRCLLTQMV